MAIGPPMFLPATRPVSIPRTVRTTVVEALTVASKPSPMASTNVSGS